METECGRIRKGFREDWRMIGGAQNERKLRKTMFHVFLHFLFCFFVLETILLGKALNIDPYNQPSVELIKKETKKFLI